MPATWELWLSDRERELQFGVLRLSVTANVQPDYDYQSAIKI
jgi:hypothetical protein